MAQLTADSASRRPTREQPPHPALLREGTEALRAEATRLDVAYQRQMEAVARARKAEAALLTGLLACVRPVLPALAHPLLLLDVGAPGRSQLLHLRAVWLFGNKPRPRAPQAGEGVFLLEDTAFLRVRFTGASAPGPGGQPVFGAERLEGIDARGVLRDYSAEEVTAVLLAAMTAETAHRRARSRDLAATVARLQAVCVLLAG